jgi:acetyl esterase/lipase
MNASKTILTLGLLASTAMMNQVQADDRTVIPIWPEGVPGLRADASPEKEEAGGHFSNIHQPTLTVFVPPAGQANGTAVIICPGGAYSHLAFNQEGIAPAQWYNSLGVTAFILKYRLKEYGQPAPLQDVLRAIRLVRSRAKEFGVRLNRIGVLGFSAGGHLTACAGTLFDAPEGRTGSALDDTSARPDFIMLLYPVITMEAPYVHVGSLHSLLGAAPAPELVRRYSVEQQVTKSTPPAFIVQSEEDRAVPVENSLMFYEALRKAGVPAELHLYAKGPHGFGLATGLGPASEWPKLCEKWMRFNGWLPPLAGSK